MALTKGLERPPGQEENVGMTRTTLQIPLQADSDPFRPGESATDSTVTVRLYMQSRREFESGRYDAGNQMAGKKPPFQPSGRVKRSSGSAIDSGISVGLARTADES